MGTLNTSININSSDTLPFYLNQTVVSNTLTGEFVESGVKNISTFTQEYFYGGDGHLSTKTCGANGAYVFVQSPLTNTNNVKLYGLQQINEEFEEETFNGIEAFATLKPGDSMLVPITPQQTGIFACTTFGTGSINYYIADRKGAFGESDIFLDTNQSNYRYIVMDSQLAETLPSGYPLPYTTSGSINSKDLNVSVSDYNINNSHIINNKGYIFAFYNRSDSSQNIIKYIDSKGEVVDTIYRTGSYSFSDLEQKVNIFSYYESSSVTIKVFDGDNIYSHSFATDNGYNIRTDFDKCSSNGSFLIDIYDYNGISDNTLTVLINKDKAYHLQELNYSSTNLYVNDAAVYLYGNFVFLTVYNDDTSYYTRFQIWNTDGKLLKDINLLSPQQYNFGSIDYVMYGENKIQIIFTNGDGDYLLNYNGTTDKLIGYDNVTGLLNQFHQSTGNYSNRIIYAYNKYPTNSIRPYNYVWNSGLFDAESLAIIYSDISHNLSYHINSQVNYCDIVYLLNGQTEYNTYRFANDITSYIRIPYQYEYNRITPSSNLIAFTYGATSYSTGSLNLLAITPSGIVTSSLANDLDNTHGINSTSDNVIVKPVGDYIMYSFYTPSTDITTFKMVKGANVKDTLNVSGDERNNFRRRTNSLFIFSNYDEKVYYFNTLNDRFTEIPNGYYFYDDAELNNSITTNGLNDGNILFPPNNVSPGSNPNMILFKKGVSSSPVNLPETDGYHNIQLGSEAIFYAYQDMNDSYKWKLNVYDLNLNLNKTLSLLTNNISEFYVLGKRCWIESHNADIFGNPNLYSSYMVSLNGIAYWTNSANISPIFDDKYWWDYIY